MVWTELHSHIPLQQVLRFCIPLESTCCLFVAHCYEFRNRKSYDRFVVPVKRDLKKFPIWLNNHGKSFKKLSNLSSCLLLQRLRFRKIRSNVLWGIESDLVYTKVSWVVSQYIFRSWSLWHSLSSSILLNKHIFY